MMFELYIWFRIALFLFTFTAMIGNFASWSTKHMTNDYFYQRKKSGWWCLFCVGFLIFQTEYWSLV